MPLKFIALILLFCSCVFGWDINDEMEKILTQNQKNILKNYATKKDLKILEKKFKENKALGIRIYGDSHMAADFFPRVMRDYVLRSNAVGFAYPLQPKYQQNLNLKYDYKNYTIFNSKNTKEQELNYPLGGVIANANEKGARIDLDTKLENKKFKIGFVFKSPLTQNAFVVEDSKGKKYTLQTSKTNKWSYKELELVFPIRIEATQKDAQLGGYFITDIKGKNVFLDTIAINGARSNLWKNWNEKVVKEQLDLLKNDLIILAYGTNDALFKDFDRGKFKKDFQAWVKILKNYNPKSVFILISPPTVKNSHFNTVREALQELAKEEKTLLFDMHEFMQESGGKDLWIEKKLSLKDVHLTVKGYELMAKKMLGDFRKLFH